MMKFAFIFASYGCCTDGRCERRSVRVHVDWTEGLVGLWCTIGREEGWFGLRGPPSTLPVGRLPVNGEVAFVGNCSAEHDDSVGLSVSVNALQGLTALKKQRGVGR